MFDCESVYCRIKFTCAALALSLAVCWMLILLQSLAIIVTRCCVCATIFFRTFTVWMAAVIRETVYYLCVLLLTAHINDEKRQPTQQNKKQMASAATAPATTEWITKKNRHRATKKKQCENIVELKWCTMAFTIAVYRKYQSELNREWMRQKSTHTCTREKERNKGIFIILPGFMAETLRSKCFVCGFMCFACVCGRQVFVWISSNSWASLQINNTPTANSCEHNSRFNEYVPSGNIHWGSTELSRAGHRKKRTRTRFEFRFSTFVGIFFSLPLCESHSFGIERINDDNNALFDSALFFLIKISLRSFFFASSIFGE